MFFYFFIILSRARRFWPIVCCIWRKSVRGYQILVFDVFLVEIIVLHNIVIQKFIQILLKNRDHFIILSVRLGLFETDRFEHFIIMIYSIIELGILFAGHLISILIRFTFVFELGHIFAFLPKLYSIILSNHFIKFFFWLIVSSEG